MNIYEFFNSRDVAEHCKSIKQPFTAMDMAYVVWNSGHHTLAEKHKAWEQIIDTMPDETFCGDCYIPLHSFLRTHMDLQNAYIEQFTETKGDYVYTAMLWDPFDEEYQFSQVYYDNFHACLESVKHSIEHRVKIVRYRLHTSAIPDSDSEECEAIVFNKHLAVLEIELDEYAYLDEAESNFYLHAEPVFSEMRITIPSPFKTGDVVYNVLSPQHEPFVLDGYAFAHLKEERAEGMEAMFRLAEGWFLDDNSKPYLFSGGDYLDLAYYPDAIPKEYARLAATMRTAENSPL